MPGQGGAWNTVPLPREFLRLPYIFLRDDLCRGQMTLLGFRAWRGDDLRPAFLWNVLDSRRFRVLTLTSPFMLS